MAHVLDVRKEALEGERRIRAHVRETPLEPSLSLSHLGNCRVHLKMENLQITGSFKLRGAVNKFLSLSGEEKRRRLVTASTGNHANALAHVLKHFGAKGEIHLPSTASPAKLEALRLYGVEIGFHGEDCVETELFAKGRAEQEGLVWISPYNDPYIIGGQATVGVELARQMDHIDTVLVPVGGGGLIAGIAGYLKSVDPNVEIIGCQPQASCAMSASVRAGTIVEVESKPTLADGTAGGIEPGAMTLELCRRFVDDFILVSEEELGDAIRWLIEKHYVLVEGAGALSVASFVKERQRFEGKDVALVLSGSKIRLETLQQVLCSH